MSPPGGPPSALPVIATVQQAWRDTFGNLGAVLYLGGFPMLLLLAFDQLFAALDGGRHSLWLFGASKLVEQYLSASLLVSWLRLHLLGEQNKASPFQVPFAGQEARMFLLLLVMNLPLALSTAMLATADQANPGTVLPGLFTFAVTVVVLVRISLAMPAVAGGAPLDLRQAWRTVSGNALRLCGAMVLAGIPVVALWSMIVQAALAGGGLGYLSALTLQALEFVLTAIEAAVLALAYRHLAGGGAPPAPPAVTGQTE